MTKMRLLYFVPFLMSQCFTVTFAMISVTNLTTDQSALLAFKSHISDPRRVLATNWSISYPICSWVGVSCGARHHRVTLLNVSSIGLGGTIPPHLGNLSFLVYLNVEDNNFHGHLPNELGQLRRLKFLRLGGNQLSGSFPSWIGTLSNLQRLALYENNFTGPITNSFFNLSKLRGLGLGDNHFNGKIPIDMCTHLPKLEIINLYSNEFFGHIPSSLSDCTHLQQLWLSDNKFSGRLPQNIGNLTKLDYLSLQNNNLQGEIPVEIFNISTLSVLSLVGNQLTGHLPSTLGHTLPNLEGLTLGQNEFTGTIPNSITNASRLTVLDLDQNYFSGLIPNSFGNLRFLTELNLGWNNLTTKLSSTGEWSFISSLTNCVNLTLIDVDHNPLGGVLSPLIGNLSTSLQSFDANDCRLKGNIPQEIGNLHSLIVLSLHRNGLNGVIPSMLGRLHHLQGLGLFANNLQGTIPRDLCDLKGLYVLYLDGNKLSGQIPHCFGTLTSLRDLDLSSNKLTYSIPSSFWSLQYILHINLSSNSLRGSLPANVGNLKVVIDLDLSRNQLSGDIPTTIGGLQDLQTLSLASNHFQGSIPDTFGRMESLESVDLSYNNLTGEIPMSLEALSHLKRFNVSRNRLEGKIPTQGPFRNFSAQSFVWNYALCGPVKLQVLPCKEDDNKDYKKDNIVVLKYVLPPIISVGVIIIIIIVFIRRRKRNARTLSQEDLVPLATWRRISYLDVQRATDGFNESNLLGTGSFGTVYKATLLDGTNVAVKVFNLQLEKAFVSFDSECEVLRNVRHRNLIEIISSCCNMDFKALVLEFMPNGSLEKWLYSYNYFLDILQRLDIMIDVALALEYLHHGHSASAPVVHCDLKPSNILLDENMVAHVSDFGISKLLGEGDDSVTQTMTMATIGYMAPEYGSEGIVSVKCDVYSFGILLMETFTRKKPTDEMFVGEMSLKNWVKNSLPQGLTEVVDANLILEKHKFPTKMDCLLSIMDLAMDCCAESPEQRICMIDAAARLKKTKVMFLDDAAAAATN